MAKLSPIEEISTLSKHIPLEALKDINGRIGDWLASGGKEDDPYIEQQLRYAKRFAPSQSALS